jgi:rubrerythrin
MDINDPQAAKRFASRFFGVPAANVVAVGESYATSVWPEKRWPSLAPVDPARVLQMCVEAVDGPDQRIIDAFSALCGRKPPQNEDLQTSLYDQLSEAEPVFQLATLLAKPMVLIDAAKALATALGRTVTEEELLSWLILGAIAMKEGRPLLRPVVHAFLRGIGGASVAFPGSRSDPELHFSAEQAEESGRFRMPVSTCTTCGQHYFTTHLHDFHHTSQTLGGGQAAKGSRYWEPLDPSKGGKRCILIDGLASGEDLPADKAVKVLLCRHCGTLHEQDEATCGHCGRSDKKVILHSIQTKEDNEGYLSRCIGCDANGRRWGASYREPARPVRTTTVADIHVLAQDMINNLDPQRLLVFCDNRQDAAFQAGWMRDHARRFRLRSLIAEELKKGPQGVGDLSVSLSLMFEQEEGLSRALLPEVWRVVPLDAGQNHRKEREKFLRMAILREITLSPRQVLGLEPWGRMKIDYIGLTPNLPFIVNHSRGLRVPQEELCWGIITLLDYLRRRRVLFDPVHKTFSKFWNDGDLEILNGYLPQMDPPRGTKLTRTADDKENYVLQWKGLSGDTFIKQAVRKWGVPDEDLPVFLEKLFGFLTSGGWLIPVNLIGAKGHSLPGQSGLYQIDMGKIQMLSAQGVWKCKRCGRRTARRTPNDHCPAWRCEGTLEFTAENPDDYNLRLLDGHYDLIRPEEHTAMVPHDKREKIENWFKDPASKGVNCLVCTQTLEMGVDIGALDAVLMRNAPPLPANYWQRVGRAGRRNRMAVDMTYCRDVSHDRSYFSAPEKLLDGGIDAPTFNLSNQLMVRRHIHATVLTRLHQEARTDRALQEILNAAVPTTVRAWLFEGNQIRSSLPDLSPIEQAVSSRTPDLLDHVKKIFAAGWPLEDSAVVSDALLKEAVEGFTTQLRAVMVRLKRRLNWAHQTVTRLNLLQASTGTLEPGDEAIRRRCERHIKRIKGELKKNKSEGEGRDETVAYSVLGVEGFLPGYGLERGTIVGTAEIPFWESKDAGELYLPRPPLLALREYVPGNLIYANGHRFVSRRYQLLPAEERESTLLEVTVTRSALREVDAGAAPSPTSRVLQSLPMDDVDLVHVSQITDEEDYRFQMGVAVLGHERNRHSGGKVFTWGLQEAYLIKAMHLRMANVGSTTEIQRRINFGYLICSVCGDSVSPLASQAQKTSFKAGHRERCGGDAKDVAQEFALHADVVADTLKFPGFADQTEAYSVLESIRLAAANCIEMVPEDLQILVIGQMDSDEVAGCLMDPMPGGSGLLEQLVGRFQEIRDEAINIVQTCPSECQTSCTDCLQTYRHAFYHPYLDRNRALQFLESSGPQMSFARTVPVMHYGGTTASGEKSPVNAAERRLRRMLLAAGFPEATSWQEQVHLGSGLGTTTPDAIYRPDDDDLRPVAIYLDGLSSHLHGNPQTAERDRIIRAQLREMGWEVMSITAHELHDHGAMAKHFKALARYLDRGDLRSGVSERRDWFDLEDEEAGEVDTVSANAQASGSINPASIPFEMLPESPSKST